MTNQVIEKVAKAIKSAYGILLPYDALNEEAKNGYRLQAKAAIGALHGVMNDVPKVGMGDRLLWENALTRIETFIATGK